MLSQQGHAQPSAAPQDLRPPSNRPITPICMRPPQTSHALLHPQPKQISKEQLFIHDAVDTSPPTCAPPHHPPHGVTHLAGSLPGTTALQHPDPPRILRPALPSLSVTTQPAVPQLGLQDGLGVPPLAGEGKTPCQAWVGAGELLPGHPGASCHLPASHCHTPLRSRQRVCPSPQEEKCSQGQNEKLSQHQAGAGADFLLPEFTLALPWARAPWPWEQHWHCSRPALEVQVAAGCL